ncbi:hypothetical protein MRX96_037390 [Rhipicephalus microplus]
MEADLQDLDQDLLLPLLWPLRQFQGPNNHPRFPPTRPAATAISKSEASNRPLSSFAQASSTSTITPCTASTTTTSTWSATCPCSTRTETISGPPHLYDQPQHHNPGRSLAQVSALDLHQKDHNLDHQHPLVNHPFRYQGLLQDHQHLQDNQLLQHLQDPVHHPHHLSGLLPQVSSLSLGHPPHQDHRDQLNQGVQEAKDLLFLIYPIRNSMNFISNLSDHNKANRTTTISIATNASPTFPISQTSRATRNNQDLLFVLHQHLGLQHTYLQHSHVLHNFQNLPGQCLHRLAQYRDHLDPHHGLLRQPGLLHLGHQHIYLLNHLQRRDLLHLHLLHNDHLHHSDQCLHLGHQHICHLNHLLYRDLPHLCLLHHGHLHHPDHLHYQDHHHLPLRLPVSLNYHDQRQHQDLHHLCLQPHGHLHHHDQLQPQGHQLLYHLVPTSQRPLPPSPRPPYGPPAISKFHSCTIPSKAPSSYRTIAHTTSFSPISRICDTAPLQAFSSSIPTNTTRSGRYESPTELSSTATNYTTTKSTATTAITTSPTTSNTAHSRTSASTIGFPRKSRLWKQAPYKAQATRVRRTATTSWTTSSCSTTTSECP